jgi:hypothetical protein
MQGLVGTIAEQDEAGFFGPDTDANYVHSSRAVWNFGGNRA